MHSVNSCCGESEADAGHLRLGRTRRSTRRPWVAPQGDPGRRAGERLDDRESRVSVSLGDRNRAGDRRARPARERCARGRATGRVGRDPEPARQRHRGGSWRCWKHRGPCVDRGSDRGCGCTPPCWRTGPGNGAPRGVARCRVTPAAHRTRRPCLLRRCRTHALPQPTSRRIEDGPNRVTQAKAPSRRLKPNRALEVGERNPFTFPSPDKQARRSSLLRLDSLRAVAPAGGHVARAVMRAITHVEGKPMRSSRRRTPASRQQRSSRSRPATCSFLCEKQQWFVHEPH
jgi:hypothetical protein